MIRKLTSLYRTPGNGEHLTFHFAYYEEVDGRLEWNGDWDEGEISIDELHDRIKDKLTSRKEVLHGQGSQNNSPA